jgi:hypothetical protein
VLRARHNVGTQNPGDAITFGSGARHGPHRQRNKAIEG